MADVIEIRWHARGGQGAVTAGRLLAEMALEQNLYFQAFPEYGPERMGAPITCFNRLSREPINIYGSVENPSVVVVVDPTLLDSVNFTTGLGSGGQIVVNTAEPPADLQRRLQLTDFHVYTVNAATISQETMGRVMPNTPILGALIRVLGVIPLEQASAFLQKSFSERFNPRVAEQNVQALKRAYAEVAGI